MSSEQQPPPPPATAAAAATQPVAVVGRQTSQPPAYVPVVQSQQQQQPVNPGGMFYYPQAQQQAPIVMGAQVIQYQTPHYDYTPSSFRMFSILTIIVCGLFSPLSLVFSIPALLFSNKSQISAKLGSIKLARSQGVVAAYLNVTAILFAIILATVLTGLVLGLYGQQWAFQRCLSKAEDQIESGVFNDYQWIPC